MRANQVCDTFSQSARQYDQHAGVQKEAARHLAQFICEHETGQCLEPIVEIGRRVVEAAARLIGTTSSDAPMLRDVLAQACVLLAAEQLGARAETSPSMAANRPCACGKPTARPRPYAVISASISAASAKSGWVGFMRRAG